MSQENINKLKRYAESIGISPDYYDIGEQVYDEEHTQELEYFVNED